MNVNEVKFYNWKQTVVHVLQREVDNMIMH